MANFTELMNHIARFLKDMLERFLSILGFIDETKNNLDSASELQSEKAAE